MRKQLVLECRKRGYYVPSLVSDSIDRLEEAKQKLEQENKLRETEELSNEKSSKEGKGWFGKFLKW